MEKQNDKDGRGIPEIETCRIYRNTEKQRHIRRGEKYYYSQFEEFFMNFSDIEPLIWELNVLFSKNRDFLPVDEERRILDLLSQLDDAIRSIRKEESIFELKKWETSIPSIIRLVETLVSYFMN